MYSRSKKPSLKSKDFWPSWRYSPDGEGRIFDKPEDVPYGWTRRVGQQLEEVAPPALNRSDLIDLLTKADITIDPTWGTAHMKKVLDDRCPSR